MVRGAVAAFELAALSQLDRPGVGGFEWRPRPLSAAAIYNLAARTIASIPFVHLSAEQARMRAKLKRILGDAAETSSVDEERLLGVRDRWINELADIGLMPRIRGLLPRRT